MDRDDIDSLAEHREVAADHVRILPAMHARERKESEDRSTRRKALDLDLGRSTGGCRDDGPRERQRFRRCSSGCVREPVVGGCAGGGRGLLDDDGLRRLSQANLGGAPERRLPAS